MTVAGRRVAAVKKHTVADFHFRTHRRKHETYNRWRHSRNQDRFRTHLHCGWSLPFETSRKVPPSALVHDVQTTIASPITPYPPVPARFGSDACARTLPFDRTGYFRVAVAPASRQEGVNAAGGEEPSLPEGMHRA